jgi:hypothetical protein
VVSSLPAAAASPERLGARLQQPFGPDEFVYTGAGFDHWIHANPDPEFPNELAALLDELRPTWCTCTTTRTSASKLCCTSAALPERAHRADAHEYLAICNHFGQMVKAPGLRPVRAFRPARLRPVLPRAHGAGLLPARALPQALLRPRPTTSFPEPGFRAQSLLRMGFAPNAISVPRTAFLRRKRRAAPRRALEDGLVLRLLRQILALEKANRRPVRSAALLEKDVGSAASASRCHRRLLGHPRVPRAFEPAARGHAA